jgi:hypothetical protein
VMSNGSSAVPTAVRVWRPVVPSSGNRLLITASA